MYETVDDPKFIKGNVLRKQHSFNEMAVSTRLLILNNTKLLRATKRLRNGP